MIAGIFVRLTNVDELDLIGINEPLGLFGTNACKGFLLVGFHLASLPNGGRARRPRVVLQAEAARGGAAAPCCADRGPRAGAAGTARTIAGCAWRWPMAPTRWPRALAPRMHRH